MGEINEIQKLSGLTNCLAAYTHVDFDFVLNRRGKLAHTVVGFGF